MKFKEFFMLASVLVVNAKNLPANNTAIITEYAKVARWGSPILATEKSQDEGRSSGQSLWTHRSDVRINSGQNIKMSKPSIVYPIRKVTSKLGDTKSESLPGVGEVVQERFNPRPYFDYAPAPGKYENSKKAADSAAPAPPPPPPPTSPTFDSFPVFKPPEAPKNPPSDSYSSPYSSYNPPKSSAGSEDSNGGDIAYPPNAPPPPGDTVVDAPPSDSDKDYGPHQPKDTDDDSDSVDHPPGPSYPSLGPPLAPHDDHPPNPPPKHEQLYYPPSDDGSHPEVILDHPPPGYEDDKGKDHDMGEQDLAPPPSPDVGPRFPQYLYSDHDFHGYPYEDHHVYKEITTTTTEAPEDERVNKGHYSYYYLGRKLWYIPLYFSVYFIIYVTVLILKSIARHKIDFKHKFHYDNRHARQLGINDKIDEIHQNVTTAIDTSRKKFPYIAM